MIYSAYKSNQQGNSIQPWLYSFPNLETVWCSTSGPNCCFLICIQISQDTGKVDWYSHLSKKFPVCCDPPSQRLWHSQCRSRFFWNSLAFSITDFGNFISGSSTFSKSMLKIWKFLVHILLKPSLENFQLYFASVWDECSCAVVWTFLGIAFLWDWNEDRRFPSSYDYVLANGMWVDVVSFRHAVKAPV